MLNIIDVIFYFAILLNSLTSTDLARTTSLPTGGFSINYLGFLFGYGSG